MKYRIISEVFALCNLLVCCNLCTAEDSPETMKLCRKLARHYESCLEDRQKLFSIADQTSQLGTYWLLLTAERKSAEDYRIGEYDRERFIGFLEAQGVHPPDWWNELIVEDRWLSVSPFFWELHEYLYELNQLKKMGKAEDKFLGNVPMLPEMKLMNSGKEISITINGEHRVISDLDSLPREYGYVPYLHLGDTKTYLLLRQTQGHLQNMELFTYDLSGKFVWKQSFAKQPRRVVFGGPLPATRVELIEQEGELFVYRSDINGAGFDCLDSQTGETKYLFMTGLTRGAIEFIDNRKSSAELMIAKGIYRRGDPESVKQAVEKFTSIMNRYPSTKAGAEAEYLLQNYETLSPNKKYIKLKELLK